MDRNPLDRLYDAITRGDAKGARASCAPHAHFWHCFDGVTQTLDEAVESWKQLFAGSASRGIRDVHRDPIPGGFVQRHFFTMTPPDGTPLTWAVCLIVRVDGGLITRVDEYIDRKGFLPQPPAGR